MSAAGWLCVSSWAGGALWAFGAGGPSRAALATMPRGRAQVTTANSIMAVIGIALGIMPGVLGFVWRNAAALQGIIAGVAVLALLHAYGGSGGGAGGNSTSTAGESEPAATPAAATPPLSAVSGDTGGGGEGVALEHEE